MRNTPTDRRAALTRPGDDPSGSRNSPTSIFRIFLRLGLTSFGGPVAHLGYFRIEFVERRCWLDDQAFADLVALCQFLPGPASSQTGFGIGLLRGGILGGLAAWAGFTLPSAMLMMLFAYGAHDIASSVAGIGLLHGLKLAAVAIVAQAVLGMTRTLCADRIRASIAVLAVIITALASGTLGQLSAIAAGALLGLVLLGEPYASRSEVHAVPISRETAPACLVAFAALLALSFVPTRVDAVAFWDAFYRSGALVFGGGHVVLPLLREAVVSPGWVSDGTFLAGYGAAQALPGPLFTFAAYLGAVAATSPHGVAGALIALAAIFLPGMLALLAVMPFWPALRAKANARAVMAGVNAAVVGLLATAFYNPVWISSVGNAADFAVAVTGFVLLVGWRAPFLLVVAGAGLAGVGLAEI